MPTKIRAADARNNFAEILGRAHFGGERFLIEKQGKPFAVVLGFEEYCKLIERLSELNKAAVQNEPDGRDEPPLTAR
ncbi:MAG: type II toxin-antitoxin system Phd/YefM family antitoxin [Chloroflexota bacterium]|jgi:prevent-host-death family protein